MIPEAGTREVLQRALFEALRIPFPGEVYRHTRSNELWQVVKRPRHASNVLYTVYRLKDINPFEFDGVLVMRPTKEVMSLDEWAVFIQRGALSYVGDELPSLYDP